LTAKPKVAFYWCASCGGCEEAVIDLNEDILKVAELVDIVFWPIAADFKQKAVEEIGDGEITVTFINGAIRTEEQEEMARLLRKKSKLIMAFGSCAWLGGIPGLANLWSREAVFKRIYKDAPTIINPEETIPKRKVNMGKWELTLPEFYDTVKTLDQTVPVDYYLPGCPPPADLILKAINAVVKGELPEKSSVLAPDKALCSTCPLAERKPEKISIKNLKRPHEVKHDPNKCFLEEGVICLGFATGSGCGERCIRANMPCRGCMGPTSEVRDQGAKALSAIASILAVDEEEEMSEEEVEKLISQVIDPLGTFYRFSLPSSLLRRSRPENPHEEV
jgi:F420-non-reducing hydrogenase small subunit